MLVHFFPQWFGMCVASLTTVEPIGCYPCPGTAEVFLVAVAMSTPSRQVGQAPDIQEGMTGMSFHFGELSSSFKVSLYASLRKKYILG